MKKFIFMSCLALSCTGLAKGGTSSGGGNSVVCFDSSGKITSAELLDLYEARNLLGLTIPTGTGNYLHQAKEAATILTNSSRWLMKEPFLIIIEGIDKQKAILQKGVKLVRIDDSNEIILPTNNCGIFQTARFESNNRLYINGDIWEKLDNQSKAALLVHEVLYKFLRNYGEKNSVRVREAVGNAFAKTRLESESDLPSGATEIQYCTTGIGLPRFLFTKYTTSDGYVFQFHIYDGRIMMSKATATGFLMYPIFKLTTQMDQGLNTTVAAWVDHPVSGEQKFYINTFDDVNSTFTKGYEVTCK